MDLSLTLFRTIVTIGAALFLESIAHAGTSDLFRATASFHCTTTNSTLKLGNKQLINLALGHALQAKLPPHLALGLQCNCATLEMDLVVYDSHTTNTVATVASFQNAAYQTDGQKAWTLASGTVNETGSLARGTLAAHLTVQLSSNACVAQTRLAANGQFTIATTTGFLPLILQNGTVSTHGPQLRSAAMTGADFTADPPLGFAGGSVMSNFNGATGVLIAGGNNNNTLVVTNGGLVIGSGFGNSVTLANGGLISSNLTFGNNVTVTGNATLIMELTGYGNGVGTNDVLNLDGNFQYGGTLVVTNITGFAYALGQSFQLFNFGSQSGDFSVTNLPNLTPYGLTWDTSQLDTSGLLTIVTNPATDSLTISNLEQVINLSSPEILNVCTNDLTADALAVLFNIAPTNSTIVLTNCAPPTQAP